MPTPSLPLIKHSPLAWATCSEVTTMRSQPTIALSTAARTRLASRLDRFGRSVRRLSRRIAPAPASPGEEELRQRWSRWLERAQEEIVIMHDHQASWDDLVDIVEGNPYIPAPNHVMDFIRDLYGIVIAVGVRRQADKSEDVANLRRLMNEIARHPDALKREWFVDRYPEFMRDVGQTEFDQFAGPGGHAVDPEIVRRDLATLGNAATKVKSYVNQHLAHSADDPEGPIPTYSDLRDCLAVLDGLLRRYYLLVNGGGMVSSTPTKQFDFRRPLLVPWAPDDRFLSYLRSTKPALGNDDVEASVRSILAAGGPVGSEEVVALLALIEALRAQLLNPS